MDDINLIIKLKEYVFCILKYKPRLLSQQELHNTGKLYNIDEAFLLQQLAKGSEDAFARLYKTYQPKVFRFLFPFNTGEDPREITQDIFLKIWEKREVLITIHSFEQYVYRMAKNRLIDLQKSNKARQQRETWVQNNVGNVEEASFNKAEYKEVFDHALKIIHELTERQQLIYRLRMFEDKSLDEISELLSLSKAVVIKQLYLATRFIREKLREYHHLEIFLLVGLALFPGYLLF